MNSDKIDYVVLPLVFAGLHVVTYAMTKSQVEQTAKCTADKMGSCKGLDAKLRAIRYMTMAAVAVGAAWVFRQLSRRAIGIGAAGLVIPALFFVGQALDACSGQACDAASMASAVLAGPAFWGTVAYAVLQLTHRL